MKSQQIPINGRPRRRPHLPAAAGKAARTFEERVIWPSEDAARAAGGATRRGLDRTLWELQRRLVWPLQDRAREPGGPSQIVAVVGAALVAVVLGVAGLLWATSGGSSAGPTATKVAVAAPKTHPQKQAAAATPKPAPTLHGAAPVFKPTKPSKSPTRSSKPAQSSAPSEPAATETATETATASSSSAATSKISSSPGAAATTSSTPLSDTTAGAEPTSAAGPPAGHAAIAVAREFADAFVTYEIGGTEAKVRGAFKATATGELARSLLKRPPKQPATVKVPRAKVVNIVAAPSQGGVYPVSVSLLRVGVTSELRLEMEKTKKDRWRVTNVLG